MGLPRYLQNMKREILNEINADSLSRNTLMKFINFNLNSTIIYNPHPRMHWPIYVKHKPIYHEFETEGRKVDPEKYYLSLRDPSYCINQVLKDHYGFFRLKYRERLDFEETTSYFFIKFQRRKSNGTWTRIEENRRVKIKFRQTKWLEKVNTNKQNAHIAEWNSNQLLYDVKYNRKYNTRGFPPTLSRLIFERDLYTCQICGITKEEARKKGLHMEADHIVEWEDGGETSYKNGQTLCSQCNKAKYHFKRLMSGYRKKTSNNMHRKINNDQRIKITRLTIKEGRRLSIENWFKINQDT